MTRYQYEYTAKLVPLNVPLTIPERDGQPSFSYTFDHQTFAGEKGSKRVIDVCDDHQRHKVIGKVNKLIAQLGWWECEFTLDTDQPELERGQPVSIGLQTLGIGSGIPFITEVSVVPHGAVKGAVVRNRRLLPVAEPEPAKPIAASTKPTLVAATPATATRPVRVMSRAQTHRDARRHAEEDELNRRLDWLEQHGIRPDMETVIENMKADLGNGDTLARLYATHMRRTGAADGHEDKGTGAMVTTWVTAT